MTKFVEQKEKGVMRLESCLAPFKTACVIVMLVLLTGCSEAPRGVKRDRLSLQFDLLELSQSRSSPDSVSSKASFAELQPIGLPSTDLSSGLDRLLFNFALELLANQQLHSPSLRFASYRAACLANSAPTEAFFAFVLPSSELPAFPYVIASVELLLLEGRAILESDLVQPGWQQLNEPTFTYLPTVLLQDALTISEQHGSRMVEEKLGETCEVRALLQPHAWELSWYASASFGERSAFAIRIDANTGDVIGIYPMDES